MEIALSLSITRQGARGGDPGAARSSRSLRRPVDSSLRPPPLLLCSSPVHARRTGARSIQAPFFTGTRVARPRADDRCARISAVGKPCGWGRAPRNRRAEALVVGGEQASAPPALREPVCASAPSRRDAVGIARRAPQHPRLFAIPSSADDDGDLLPQDASRDPRAIPCSREPSKMTYADLVAGASPTLEASRPTRPCWPSSRMPERTGTLC
jgi:hypothetical protein